MVDRHASHANLYVLIFARSNHVRMLSIHPHTIQKLHPLDRRVMKPVLSGRENIPT
jgi:hypothetical protein